MLLDFFEIVNIPNTILDWNLKYRIWTMICDHIMHRNRLFLFEIERNLTDFQIKSKSNPSKSWRIRT